ncbi:hypothetical protein D3C77_539380 [compost metagenome]
MSATSTDFPSTREAIRIDAETGRETPVLLIMSARMAATMCRMMKKKMVGGSALSASCLIVASTDFMLPPRYSEAELRVLKFRPDAPSPELLRREKRFFVTIERTGVVFDSRLLLRLGFHFLFNLRIHISADLVDAKACRTLAWWVLDKGLQECSGFHHGQFR